MYGKFVGFDLVLIKDGFDPIIEGTDSDSEDHFL
jgi:hypothetical protein